MPIETKPLSKPSPDLSILGNSLSKSYQKMDCSNDNLDSAYEADLVLLYDPLMSKVLASMGVNPQLICDIKQESWIVIITKLREGHVRKPDKIASFICSVCRYKAIEMLRKNKRSQILAEAIKNEGSQVLENSVERNVENIQRKRRLLKAISSLSKKRDQRILWNSLFMGKPKSEQLLELGVKSAHFDRVLYRAKQRISQVLAV